jgi:hypothetical protein
MCHGVRGGVGKGLVVRVWVVWVRVRREVLVTGVQVGKRAAKGQELRPLLLLRRAEEEEEEYK